MYPAVNLPYDDSGKRKNEIQSGKKTCNSAYYGDKQKTDIHIVLAPPVDCCPAYLIRILVSYEGTERILNDSLTRS